MEVVLGRPCVCRSANKETSAELSFITTMFTLDDPADLFKQTALPKHCGRRPNGETIKRETGTWPCQGLIGSGSEEGSGTSLGPFGDECVV